MSVRLFVHKNLNVCNHQKEKPITPPVCHLRHFAKHELKHFILLLFLIISQFSSHSSKHSLETSSAKIRFVLSKVIDTISRMAINVK